MTIQEYSELIAQVAKIEMMVEQLKGMRQKTDDISNEQARAYHDNADKDTVYEINNRWLAAFNERNKMERKIKREHKAFRAKIENGEFSYLAHDFHYASDKSDSSFYWYVRYSVVREAKNIKFTTNGE